MVLWPIRVRVRFELFYKSQYQTKWQSDNCLDIVFSRNLHFNENAAIFPENEKVRVQKKNLEILPQSSCDNHQKKIATPTFIDVASASKIVSEKTKKPFRNSRSMLCK